jgi:hypothetical protein
MVRVLDGRRSASSRVCGRWHSRNLPPRAFSRSRIARAFAIVRELGFANLSTGTLGLATLAVPGWLVPAAIVGGLAAVGHAFRRGRNFSEQTAWSPMFSRSSSSLLSS